MQACGGQSSTRSRQFLPSTMCVLETELRSSGFEANIFTLYPGDPAKASYRKQTIFFAIICERHRIWCGITWKWWPDSPSKWYQASYLYMLCLHFSPVKWVMIASHSQDCLSILDNVPETELPGQVWFGVGAVVLWLLLLWAPLLLALWGCPHPRRCQDCSWVPSVTL